MFDSTNTDQLGDTRETAQRLFVDVEAVLLEELQSSFNVKAAKINKLMTETKVV